MGDREVPLSIPLPCCRSPAGRGLVREAAARYRPRRPERTSFYRLLERHFEDYTRVHSERFEPRHGPLRRVVRRAVEQFLDCGRHESGFARLRCAGCAAEHLIAFSCQTRNLCPSCQAKRAALFAEHFVEVVRRPVPHRHVVLAIPKVLRRLFERDRRLLSLLSQAAWQALRACLQEAVGRRDALPGAVASIQTFGSFGNWNPHIHMLVTDGLIERGGRFLPAQRLEGGRLEEAFRIRLLRALRRAERLSEAFLDTLLSWEHSGFSVYVGAAVEANESATTERLARYLTRAPVALGKVHPQADGRIKLLTPPDPATGRDHKHFDALDWIQAITTQIPDARQHMVRYYGAYANRARRLYRASEDSVADPVGAGEDAGPSDAEAEWKRMRRRAWARLIARIYEVDPLVCPRCGEELRIVALITDPRVIDRILAHREARGICSPFQSRAPPAA